MTTPWVRTATWARRYPRSGTSTAPICSSTGSSTCSGRSGIYSASYCNTQHYKLGQLEYTGSDPLNPASWTKHPNPVFRAANGVHGPGHNGFFTSPDGSESWIVYHGNSSVSQGCGTTRSTRVQEFSCNSNGTPNFGSPAATSTDLAVPSRERGPITTAVKGAAYQLRLQPVGQLAIANNNSGRVLDVANCATSNGTNIRQWVWGNVACQRWSFTHTDNGW